MMNSTQHSIRSSRASRANVMLPPSEEDLLREGVARISEMIFCTVAEAIFQWFVFFFFWARSFCACVRWVDGL